MSQAPNNPFDDSFQQAKPKSGGSRIWLWVLGIVGGMILLGAISCCGGGYFLMNLGAGQIASEFAEDPAMVEQIGEINSAGADLGATFAAAKEQKDGSVLVIGVKGSKANGKIYYRTDNKSGEVTASLVMEDGQEFPLSSENYEELEGLDLEELGIEEFDPAMDAATETPSDTQTPVPATP